MLSATYEIVTIQSVRDDMPSLNHGLETGARLVDQYLRPATLHADLSKSRRDIVYIIIASAIEIKPHRFGDEIVDTLISISDQISKRERRFPAVPTRERNATQDLLVRERHAFQGEVSQKIFKRRVK